MPTRSQRGRFDGSDGSDGATAVEYALFMALVALVIVASVTAFGIAVNALFDQDDLIETFESSMA